MHVRVFFSQFYHICAESLGYTTVIVQPPVKSKSFTRLRSKMLSTSDCPGPLPLAGAGWLSRDAHATQVLCSAIEGWRDKDERLELVELRRQRSLALRPDWVDPSGSSPVSPGTDMLCRGSAASSGYRDSSRGTPARRCLCCLALGCIPYLRNCSNRSVTFLR